MKTIISYLLNLEVDTVIEVIKCIANLFLKLSYFVTVLVASAVSFFMLNEQYTKSGIIGVRSIVLVIIFFSLGFSSISIIIHDFIFNYILFSLATVVDFYYFLKSKLR